MSALAKPLQPDMFPDAGELSRAVGVLTQKFIWYYPNLAPMAGGHKAALMLGSLINWTRYLNNETPERGGWIWKTQSEWLEETGLSRHEQDSARKQLQANGLIQEKKRGMPARMYFKVNLDALGHTLSKRLAVSFDTWDWSNSAQLLKLLGRPIGFYSRLAKVTDSATCSLLLSYLMGAQRTSVTTAYTADWISPRSQTIEQRLGMSYKTQLAARKKLASIGLLDQRFSSNMSPRPEVRLRYGRMVELLRSHATPQPPIGEMHQNNAENLNTHKNSADLSSGEQGFTFSANRDLPFRQTGIYLSGKQEMPKPADRDLPFRQTSLPEREASIYTQTNKQLPQQHEQAAPQQQAQHSGCGGDDEVSQSGKQAALDYTGIDAAWHAGGANILNRLPTDLQQPVLDEWIGRFALASSQPMRYPLRFLEALAGKALKGEFRAELGVDVQAKRASRQRAAQLQRRLQTTPAAATEMPKPANSAGESVNAAPEASQAKTAALKKMAELRMGFQAQMAGKTSLLHRGQQTAPVGGLEAPPPLKQLWPPVPLRRQRWGGWLDQPPLKQLWPPVPLRRQWWGGWTVQPPLKQLWPPVPLRRQWWGGWTVQPPHKQLWPPVPLRRQWLGVLRLHTPQGQIYLGCCANDKFWVDRHTKKGIT